eukprot:scaffold104481_cov45-Phaeocystis_antarctica.AAC.1
MRPIQGALGTATSETCSALPLCDESEAVPLSAKLNFILTWVRVRVRVSFGVGVGVRVRVRARVRGHDADAAPLRLRRVYEHCGAHLHAERIAQGRLRPPQPPHHAAT